MRSRFGAPLRSLTATSDVGPDHEGSKRFAPSSGSAKRGAPPAESRSAIRQRLSRWRATAMVRPSGDQRGRAYDVKTSPAATTRTAPLGKSTVATSQCPPVQRSATARRPSGAGSALRRPSSLVRRRTLRRATSHSYSSGRSAPSARRVARQSKRRLPSANHRGSSNERPSRETSVAIACLEGG